MRRSELDHAVKVLESALDESNVQEIFSPELRKADSEDRIPNLLRAFRAYAVREAQFDAATHQLVSILELDQLIDADVWFNFMRGDDPMLFVIRDRLRFVRDHLPKIALLLRQKDIGDFLATQSEALQAASSYEKLSVIVLEDKTQFSRPERLIHVLEGIVSLHDSCARIQGLQSEQLTVLSCDSGSDKSFDFLGLAKIIEQVKEIIIGLWDRVVFFKERRLSTQIEVISEGLPVLATVSEMQKANKLSKEEAEIIRRGIIQGCKKFIEAGAIIPEIEEHAVHNPRALLAPERKLLMPPPTSSASNAEMSEAENQLSHSTHVDVKEEAPPEVTRRLRDLERRLKEMQTKVSRRKRKQATLKQEGASEV